MKPENLARLVLLAAAMRAYDRVFAWELCEACGAQWPREDGPRCRWCERRRAAQAEALLRPPARRGYGYATPADLAALGCDPDAERREDLRVWAADLRMATEAGIVDYDDAEAAIRAAERGLVGRGSERSAADG